MGFLGDHHTRIAAINGDWIDKDGVVHNLDGSVGHKPNKSSMQPIPGTYIDSQGEEQNIDTIAIFGGGGGSGGGVTMAQVNQAVAGEATIRSNADNALLQAIDQEKADRIAADTQEVTNRNTAIANAINGLPSGVTMTQVNQAIAQEATARQNADNQEVINRNTAIINAINQEVTDRNTAITNAVNGITSGKMAVPLTTGTLTNVINGTTNLAKTLFPDIADMKPGKVIINDSASTIGIYESDVDAATIQVRTISIDASGAGEDAWVLLGDIDTKADFTASALSVTSLTTLFGRTPGVMDRVGVEVDESQNNAFVEYIITDITGDVITYGNSRVINTSQYQTQTAATDVGKVPTIGGTAGTWGTPKAVDTVATAGSHNLIESGAVVTAVAGAVLKKTFGFQGDAVKTIFTITDPIAVNPVITQLYLTNMTAADPGIFDLTGASISQDMVNGSLAITFNTPPDVGQAIYICVLSMGLTVTNMP